MTSRQRVLAAIRHQPVDRVPIDFGGTRQSGISAFAYDRIRRHLGLGTTHPCRVFDTYQMLAEIDGEIANRFGADCVALNRPAVAFGIPNREWKPFTFHGAHTFLVPGGFHPEAEPDGSLVLRRGGEGIARMPSGGFYFDRFEKYPGALHPDLDTWRPPRLAQADLDHFAREAAALHENTDKAVIAALGPPYELFNGIGQGDFEAWMITFASEPEYVRALYTLLVDAWIDNLKAFHAAVGERVHILQICDDFGAQNAPFLSTEMFRDLLLPAYKQGLDWVHAHTPWKVMLHSDGAIFPLLPSILEMGVDILNPVQLTASGMGAARLKAEFGGRVVFWGASCDCQGTLTRGAPAAVADEVRANLEIFRPLEGGHVFAPVHNIQANVPPENIEALFAAALGR